MIGSRLGNWLIERELGSGGMGTVYLARENERQAALKVLAAELARDPGFQQRFQREIDALRQLDHPNIVRLLEAGEQDGRCFYVMEYVEGHTFEELLRERGRLPWAEVLDLALQVAPALKHAHDRGIIHRDLKPSNLLRTGAGIVKLTDFGIAHVFASTPLTVSGVVVGTGEFLSPEQAMGKPVSKRSDLYSLGVVLYTLLTGRTPFEGENLLDLLHKHRYGQFDPPQKLVPELPHEFARVVCELLAKDPADRPPDGQVLYRRLEGLRRRQEFREQSTLVVEPFSPAEAEEPTDFELRHPRAPGPATTMSRLMREELERQNRGGPLAQFLNRPWVLVTLLLLAAGGIAWTFWPTSPEQLFRRGAALMQSDDPEDWHRAWRDYLGPLESKYPDHPFKQEVADFRQQREEHEVQRRAGKTPGATRPMSEGEWFYQYGQRLAQRGDEADARKVWQNLAASLREVPAEQVWVRRAEEQLKKPAVPPTKDRWASVFTALDRALALRDEGKRAEAEAIWLALEELYRNDPSAARVLARIREDRQDR